jgi:hypothetical protein
LRLVHGSTRCERRLPIMGSSYCSSPAE